MKKLLALLLIVVLLLGLSACSVNKAKVAVIWEEGDRAVIPGSLIDTMERAMYTENIAYVHIDAEGDSFNQLKIANEAVQDGAGAIMVNLIDPSKAEGFVSFAKEKDIPVVFFGCDVDESVIAGYEKAVCVVTDEDSLAKVQGAQIKDYVNSKVNKKTGKNSLDKDGDGKLSYMSVGKMEKVVAETGLELIPLKDEDVTKAEIIITNDDTAALGVLEKLQSEGYNKDKLVTHYIPIFTIGSDADASIFTDTSDMDEEDKKAFVYTVTEIIGEGKMTGTVVEDRDGISAAAAQVVRNIIKGDDTYKDISEESLRENSKKIKISYVTIGG